MLFVRFTRVWPCGFVAGVTWLLTCSLSANERCVSLPLIGPRSYQVPTNSWKRGCLSRAGGEEAIDRNAILDSAASGYAISSEVGSLHFRVHVYCVDLVFMVLKNFVSRFYEV